MILSVASILIAVGALAGYQLFKGTIDKKLPIIVSIISLFVVILTTLIIIPMLLIIQNGYSPTIENLELLYSNSEFLVGIIRDSIISVLFTILGISGVVNNINKKIKESNMPLEKINISEVVSNSQITNENNQLKNSVKEIFIKHNAMTKQNATDKKIIFEELKNIPNGKSLFSTIKMQQIIRKYKGKYYFSEKFENSFGYRFVMIFLKALIWIISFTIITSTIIYFAVTNL